MVASLLARKDALEAKLRDKTLELRRLCVLEAELTGILPPETPIEPGESPPIFQYKKGAAVFTYPESVTHKLSVNEDEILTNGSRRSSPQQPFEYQYSCRYPVELAIGFNIATSSAQSHRKKLPRHSHVETDFPEYEEIGADQLDGRFRRLLHVDEPSSSAFIDRNIIRNSHLYSSFGKSGHNYPSYVHLGAHQPAAQDSRNNNYWSRNQWHRHSVCRMHHDTDSRNTDVNWRQDSNTLSKIRLARCLPNRQYATLPRNQNRGAKLQYGSLDRHRRRLPTVDNGGSVFGSAYFCGPAPHFVAHVSRAASPACAQIASSTMLSDGARRRSCRISVSSPPTESDMANTVLLPSQTYPELEQAHSQLAGRVEYPPSRSVGVFLALEREQEDLRKNTSRGREREWRETSLDSTCYVPPDSRMSPPLYLGAPVSGIESPILVRPPSAKLIAQSSPPPLFAPHPTSVPSSTSSPVESKSPVNAPALKESPVPLEAPQNHTVVEVGKWQPYREVTKPFEMSDFYKYSTKFKKNNE